MQEVKAKKLDLASPLNGKPSNKQLPPTTHTHTHTNKQVFSDANNPKHFLYAEMIYLSS
jgi:hypothetical protein